MLHKTSLCCTIKDNGKEFLDQKFYECYDCNKTLDTGMGVCYACKRLCHKSHKTNYLGKIRAYCDCGNTCSFISEKGQFSEKSVSGESTDSDADCEEIDSDSDSNSNHGPRHAHKHASDDEEYLDERLSVQYGSPEYWKERYLREAESGLESEWVFGI